MTRWIALRLAPLTALGLLLVVSAGCFGPSRGTVSGQVTYKKKPVTWGTVSVIASDNIQYPGEITPEGTYSIPNVPGGPVKILVTSPNPGDGRRPGGVARGGGDLEAKGARAPATKWVPLPDKYGDLAKTDLTGTVEGDTVIDLHLK
jgi:hypothetical protein